MTAIASARYAVHAALAARAMLFVGLTAVSLGFAPAYSMGARPPPVEDKRVAIAVLGDSTSLSFQDRLSLASSGDRGGAYRSRTFQWDEVLERLRGKEVDIGPWEVSGVSNPWLRWLDRANWPVDRAPRKEDYRYNYANNGAQCVEMNATRYRQAPRLVAMMDRDPARWKDGVVVIRIGFNDLSEAAAEVASKDPQAPIVQNMVQACLDQVGTTVALIRQTHPTTRIVLVGIFDGSDHPRNLDKWQSRSELDNMAQMFDAYDRSLQRMVAATPGSSFFDDRAWVHSHFGSRGPDGKPAYKSLQIDPDLRVVHGLGDSPDHTYVADFHSGLVWNTLWAQSMVQHLHDVLKLPITPISDEEVVRFVRSQADDR